MTEFREGELFAYVRGDSRRRVMMCVATEMHDLANRLSGEMQLSYGANVREMFEAQRDMLREWVDMLTCAAEELHMELGQVKSVAKDGSAYHCWYHKGDTTACTPVEHMHRFENSGWSHVEREDGYCEMLPSGAGSDVRCSKCGAYNIFGEYYDGDGHRAWPRFCPNCGRLVR